LTDGFISGSITVYAKASTAIQYSLGYASSGATSMQYELHVVVAGTIAPSSTGTVSSFNGRTGAVTPGSSDYTASQVGAVNALSISAARNNVINGGMDIWQRGTTFSNPNAVYTADRWLTTRYGGTGWTVSQTTAGSGLPQIQYALRVQSNSGSTAGGTYVLQSIETANSLPFSGQTVTLSFYARIGALYSGASSTSMTIQTGTGTDQSLYSGFTGQATALTIAPGSGGQPALTTSWQRYSATTSSAIASTVTQLGISLLTGGTGTAGATDYFDVTGVQLEIGSTATAFSRAGGTIQGELAACQRYYETSFDLGQTPASNSSQYGEMLVSSVNGGFSTNTYVAQSFTTKKRSTPTVNIYNTRNASATGNSVHIYTAGGSGFDSLTVVFANTNTSSFSIQPTSTSMGTSQIVCFGYAASSEL
jgi:hypothetical protein